MGPYPVQAEYRGHQPKSLQLVAGVPGSASAADAPVLIDQEGGRVQRLGPPHWPAYPPGAAFGALYDLDPAQGLRRRG